MNENLSELRDRIEPTAIIAPAEIQELLARITEQSIEAVPAHEARTLEGLSVETGISVSRLTDALSELRDPPKRRRVPVGLLILVGIAVVSVGWWLKPKPAPVSNVVVTQLETLKTSNPGSDLEGLVPLSSVTFGPDGGFAKADPNFVPTYPLPSGLSLTVEMGGVMWGTGDHRAKVLDRPLKGEALEKLRQSTTELFEYAVHDSEKRRLVGLPQVKRRYFSTGSYMYYGVAGGRLELPLAKDTDPKQRQMLIRRSVEELVQMIQSQLRQQAEFRRMNGP